MTAPVNNAIEGHKIRVLIDDRIKAVRAKDVEGATRHPRRMCFCSMLSLHRKILCNIWDRILHGNARRSGSLRFKVRSAMNCAI
jgi:hypothetical protein